MFDIIGYILFVAEILLCIWFLYSIFSIIRHGKSLAKVKLLESILPIVIFDIFLITALVYSGVDTYYTLPFTFIIKNVKIFAYELPTDMLAPLISEYSVYGLVYISLFPLILLSESFGVIVIFGSRVINSYRVKRLFNNKCDIVLKYSDDTKRYLLSNKNCILWVDSIDNKLFNELVNHGIVVLNKSFVDAKTLGKLTKAERHILAFNDTSYNVSKLLKWFEQIPNTNNTPLYMHIEATVEEMKVIRKNYNTTFADSENKFVFSFSKHEIIARNFVMDYPITKYIPRTFFNDNLSLKDDKSINVVYVGFGKVNYELFKATATQFQFVKQKGDKLVSAPVNYYLFDRDSHRLNADCLLTIEEHDYTMSKYHMLPSCEPICNINKQLIDANSIEARQLFRKLVNEDSYTYFIVSLVDDFVDISFSEGLNNAIREDKNYKIFVRSKNNENQSIVKSNDELIFFGQDDTYFTHDSIVNDGLIELAENINNVYNSLSSDKLLNMHNWSKLNVVEQFSNINCAMNVPFKLNMMGYDLVKSNSNIVPNNEYKTQYGLVENSSNDMSYYFDTTPANVLAYIEHNRWNAYYLFADFEPLDELKFIKNKKGKYAITHKDIDNMQHACLTTYYGIKQLIDIEYDMIKSRLATNPSDTQEQDIASLYSVYGYDYMVITHLDENISKTIYAIIKK